MIPEEHLYKDTILNGSSWEDIPNPPTYAKIGYVESLKRTSSEAEHGDALSELVVHSWQYYKSFIILNHIKIKIFNLLCLNL